VKRIVTPKYVEHVTMNVYVKDSQISADLSTLSATGKAQKGKKFFVDLLMLDILLLETAKPIAAYQLRLTVPSIQTLWTHEQARNRVLRYLLRSPFSDS